MEKKIIFFFIIVFSFMSAFEVRAEPESVQDFTSAYRSYKDIDDLSIATPTVVEVPFSDDFIERFDFAVLDKNTGSFEPYFFKVLTDEISVEIDADSNLNEAGFMNDNNLQTYTDFPIPNDSQGTAQINLTSAEPITSSSFTVLLDNNVALPTSVEVRAVVNGQDRIIVARRDMEQQTINFPKTTSDSWLISFTFGQPLRISELRMNQADTLKTNQRTVLFLAQPSHFYSIYFNPDRSSSVPVGEAGNLRSAKDVITVSPTSAKSNPGYSIADGDFDGIPDVLDNCVSIVNPDQEDINSNGRGDLCDDFDQDGIINSLDNCPDNPNRSQEDTDSDGIGDLCDQEESRLTERYPWIPWVGISFAGFVLVTLVVLTMRPVKIVEEGESQQVDPEKD